MPNNGLFMTPDEFKQALLDAGLTQAEFASLVGAPTRTVTHWCTVRAANVPAALVALLAARPELVDVMRQLAKRREAGRAHF